MDYFVEEINMNLDKENVKNLLKELDLSFDDDLDYTVVCRYNNEIIGTGSKRKNVLKCFGVKDEYRGEGISAAILNALIDKVLEEGYSQYFIFTKIKNKKIFENLGAKKLYSAEGVILLEDGLTSIKNYLRKLKAYLNINEDSKKRAGIVMNCNPYTLGHRYLIEKASNENDEVIVFIVEEDESYFSYEDRIRLVKEGTKDLKNVKVIGGGMYIISKATFPSYFIKEESDRLLAYTKIDSGVFSKYIAKELNIKVRYVGEEPICSVTQRYNKSLKEELLKFDVELRVIDRIKDGNAYISASRVRELLETKNEKEITSLVPKATLDFLKDRGFLD